MIKRLICILCTLALLAMPAYASEEKSEIKVNETFENYALNAFIEPSVMKVQGTDARVIFGRNQDKALYCKIQNSSFNVSIPCTSDSDEMVYSFDMKISGERIFGDIMKQSGVSFLKLDREGKVKLSNSLHAGGYGGGTWHRYTVSIDYRIKKYSVWIDGTPVILRGLLNSNMQKAEALNFSFISESGEKFTEIFLDNIRVYSGSRILKENEFPTKEKNSEVLEFTETPYTEPEDTDYINSFGKTGLNASFAPTKLVEWKALNDGDTEMLHFVQNTLEGTYADITPDTKIEGNFVYQTDVYPVSMENGNIILCRAIAEGGYRNGYNNLLYINKNGVLVSNGTTITDMPFNKWTTVAVAVDINTGEGDFYINGNLVKKDVTLHKSLGEVVMPASFRVGFETAYASCSNEYYVNAIKVYSGNKIKEFDNGDIIPDVSDGFNFNFAGEKDIHAIDILGKDSVFATNCDYYFINGKKQKYTDFGAAAYEDENGIAMVPCELLENGLNINIECGGEKIKAGGKEIKVGSKECGNITLDAAPTIKNGVYFVPAASFTKEILGKYAYVDGRGFVIVSPVQRNYSNSKQATLTEEESDIISRFILFDRPSGKQLYDAVIKHSDNMHPRMFIRKDEIPALRARIDSDKDMKKALRKLITDCEEILNSPLVAYEFVDNEGPSLHGKFREIRDRAFDLSVAFYATGDEKYLQRLWEECENVLSWEHWNLPEDGGGFLDSGMGVSGIALSYDVLYDWLSEEQREFFREKIQEKYLDYCVGVMEGTKMFKINDGRMRHSNWGAVCGASMFLIAMTFIDDLPEGDPLTEKCKFIAEGALRAMEYPMGTLYPDGAVGEGMQYWQFYVENLAWVLGACENMCGDDYGFLNSKGFYESIRYGMNVQTINGAFDFNATTPGIKIELMRELFKIAEFYGDNASMKALKDYLDVLGTDLGALGILYYKPPKEEIKDEVALDNIFEGEGVITMRSSYLDSAASYVGILGGQNVTDTQFDKGSFILELGGSRWITDMGDERKDVAGGYYHGDGFSLYKRRTEGHNCLVVNPYSKQVVDELIASGNITGYTYETYDSGYTGQTVGYSAKIKRFESKPKGAVTVLDLKDIYGTAVEKYDRGYYLSDDRHTFTLRDEAVFTKDKNDIYWFLYVKDSEVKIIDKNNLLIEKDGKVLRVEIITDVPGYNLEVLAADPVDKNMIRKADGSGVNEYNRDYYKKIQLSGKCGKSLTVSARFYLEDGNTYGNFTPQPIAQWQIPDGEISDEPKADMLYINGTKLDEFNPEKSEYSVNMFASATLPKVDVDAAEGCTAKVTQPQGVADDGVITVTNSVGRKRTYRIKFKYTEKIIENHLDVKSSLTLPDNIKMCEAVNIGATHVPEKNNFPQNTQDGDFVTRWTSDMSGAALTADLGEIKELSGFALAFFYGDERNYKYDLLISEDGYTYTRILKGATSSGKTSEYEWIGANVKARYIRYVGYGHAAGAWNNLSEFRACEYK